ncbi:hypothetical protein HYX05_03335 [Candidatus Woesearchaeota archaeon]|nr:hypothetical protein [Candidatus Woesearchaeota archaeon]
MVFGFGSKPKTYEMLPGANVTPGIFKNDAFKGLASGLEKCVGYIDATLVLGGESYTLHHTRITELGYSRWSVEVVGKSGEAMDRVMQALISTIGGRQESKDLGDGKVQIVVYPTSRDVNLSAILDAMNQYASRTQGTATVSGYRFKDLSGKLANQIRGAGLPLQEVKPT